MSNAQPPAAPSAASNVATLLEQGAPAKIAEATTSNQPPAASSSSDELPKTPKAPEPPETKPTTGIDRIKAERTRQIKKLGYTPEKDESYHPGTLAMAATCYARAAVEKQRTGTVPPPNSNWPFHQDSWKPGEDPVRMLEKAGALIAAEIDRINRLKTAK